MRDERQHLSSMALSVTATNCLGLSERELSRRTKGKAKQTKIVAGRCKYLSSISSKSDKFLLLLFRGVFGRRRADCGSVAANFRRYLDRNLMIIYRPKTDFRPSPWYDPLIGRSLSKLHNRSQTSGWSIHCRWWTIRWLLFVHREMFLEPNRTEIMASEMLINTFGEII